MIHDLKTWPEYFEEVDLERKTFEIRRDDRAVIFKVGDSLRLLEWDPVTKKYTGRKCTRLITYKTDYEQRPGYVVLGMKRGLKVPQREKLRRLLREIRDDLRLRGYVNGRGGRVVPLSASTWDKLNEYLDRGGD